MSKNDKRNDFIIQNRVWIDFLNDREKWTTQDTIIKEWLKLDGTHGETTTIELNVMTPYLEAWQTENWLLQRDEFGSINTKDAALKYQSEKELIFACANWMYENLKAISRGQRKNFQETSGIGRDEVNALLKLVTLKVAWVNEDGSFYPDFELVDSSFIPDLAKVMYTFVEYIGQYLSISPQYRTKSGVFHVGVCPYRRLKDKAECGKVFVGKTYQSRACEEHWNKYKVMDYRRKQEQKQHEK